MPSSNIEFKWGRVDCETSPTTTETHTFPEPTMTRAEMMTYFDTHFGFTENEVVALMGAHTLGGAARANSGYAGVWTAGAGREFNTKYYSMIVDDKVYVDDVIVYENAVRVWRFFFNEI